MLCENIAFTIGLCVIRLGSRFGLHLFCGLGLLGAS